MEKAIAKKIEIDAELIRAITNLLHSDVIDLRNLSGEVFEAKTVKARNKASLELVGVMNHLDDYRKALESEIAGAAS